MGGNQPKWVTKVYLVNEGQISNNISIHQTAFAPSESDPGKREEESARTHLRSKIRRVCGLISIYRPYVHQSFRTGLERREDEMHREATRVA